MSKSVWGPATWTLLHTLAAKVIDSEFAKERSSLIEFIHEICGCLPCPECRSHALSNLKAARMNLINTKQQLIDFLYEFHNRVNQQTKKPLASKEILEQYNKLNTREVVNKFCMIYTLNSKISKLMSDNFARQLLIRRFVSYLKDHGKSFSS